MLNVMVLNVITWSIIILKLVPLNGIMLKN
jgi:hypothetical protein